MARSFSTNPLAKTPIIGLFPPTTSSRHRRIDYRQSPQSPPAGDLHRILPYTCHRRVALQCSPGETAGEPRRHENHNREVGLSSSGGLFPKWKMDTAEVRERIAKLGLAAILAYGLFDGVTYTTFFVLAFLGYEKSTGKNPAANLQALLGIVLLMWTGNNITRPFRVAGAAALAPAIDKALKRIQNYFKLQSVFLAFAAVVATVAVSCLAIVGLLILSRWGK